LWSKVKSNLVWVNNHRGPHPVGYHQTVADVLTSSVNGLTPGTAQYSQSAQDALQTLYHMIEAGSLALF
jgi:hypothetical protein